LGKLVDFAIAMLILFGMMLWYQISPTIWALTIPLLVLLMMITAVGAGLWLSALSVQYRDINYAMSFIVQLLMYAAPVVYPASSVPERFRLLYALNPMVAVIEGFRSALLNTNPMPWDFMLVGSITALLLLLSGVIYFRRMERLFADLV
jgi:lipopolysaccharide transport system permease protein